MTAFLADVAAFLAGFVSLPAVFAWGWWVQRRFPTAP